MAKLEEKLVGNFDELLQRIDDGVKKSLTATLEDASNLSVGDFRCAVRVYERYSIIGKNRVSLNITLIGNRDDLYLSAIASGGSQAVLFKINTFGEENFLSCVRDVVTAFRRR